MARPKRHGVIGGGDNAKIRAAMAREFRSASPYMRFGRIDPCYAWDVRGLDHRLGTGHLGLLTACWVRISLHQGSAVGMPFADCVFDRAYMLHVGINIDDKAKLCSEVQPRPATELDFRHL